MNKVRHFRNLEQMFNAAPINQQLITGAELKVMKDQAELQLPMRESFYHAAGSLHGAVYFKLLDDAAYFAAASAEEEYFIYTKAYKLLFKRPVTGGVLIAKGQLVEKDGDEWIAISEVFDEKGKLVASGQGVFVRSKLLLKDQAGYSS
jgi:uncharacterized protein (TIGR00369 family)